LRSTVTTVTPASIAGLDRRPEGGAVVRADDEAGDPLGDRRLEVGRLLGRGGPALLLAVERQELDAAQLFGVLLGQVHHVDEEGEVQPRHREGDLERLLGAGQPGRRRQRRRHARRPGDLDQPSPRDVGVHEPVRHRRLLLVRAEDRLALASPDRALGRRPSHRPASSHVATARGRDRHGASPLLYRLSPIPYRRRCLASWSKSTLRMMIAPTTIGWT
jgi:hypothetical protein